MPRNYSDLSPHDFETLVRDLLQAEMGLRLESFPPGRDGGVDIRLHRDGKEKVVVQCKHSPGRTFSQIKSQLAKEAIKASSKFNNEERYILATSASLTRENKRETRDFFSVVRVEESDILAVDDLNNLLNLHPAIEQRNFKLWITSTAVLQRLLNSEVYERSSALIDKITARRRIYVHTSAFPIAMDILHRHHTCIISGQPGIGKTTLSEMILVKLISEGWSAYTASEDISDIERVWNPEEKQVFIYDDFLGKNSLLDSLNKNEDSRIMQTIERIRNSSNKLLLMTTREYILRQAQQVYEVLSNIGRPVDGKLILDLGHYTRIQKAQILYNHIYFSDIPQSAREQLLHDRSYKTIVDHPNFNPRLIELITANFTSSGGPADSFSEYTISALDDPDKLWEKIFESQFSEMERSLLLILATFNEPIELSDFIRAVNAYEEQCGNLRSGKHSIKLALAKLQGTFIELSSNVRLDDKFRGLHPDSFATVVRLANPSFSDYVSQYLASHAGEIPDVIDSCVFFDQVVALLSWAEGNFTRWGQWRDTLSAFIGGRRQTRLPKPKQFASGQTARLITALLRTRETHSCYWERTPNLYGIHTRKKVSPAARDSRILRLSKKHGIPLSLDDLDESCSRQTSRIRSTQWIQVDHEGDVLKLLSEHTLATCDLVQVRDDLLRRAIAQLEGPGSYQEALWLLTDIILERTEYSNEVEAELRRKFNDSIHDWDTEYAEQADTTSECEESIGAVTEAAQAFGMDEPRLPELERALEDVTAREALDRVSDEPTLFDRDHGFGSWREDVQVDSLFQTLL